MPGKPALVVCTPGAEPVAEGGYGAALLLDGWALLGRQDLRAGEETLRRWMAAAALVRPSSSGGRVIVGAEAGMAVVQALVRWDPAWHAAQELAERQELGFPPAMRMASVEGSPGRGGGPARGSAAAFVGRGAGPGAARRGRRRGQRGAGAGAGPGVARRKERRWRRRSTRRAARRDARKATEPIRIQLDPLDLHLAPRVDPQSRVMPLQSRVMPLQSHEMPAGSRRCPERTVPGREFESRRAGIPVACGGFAVDAPPAAAEVNVITWAAIAWRRASKSGSVNPVGWPSTGVCRCPPATDVRPSPSRTRLLRNIDSFDK